MHTKGPCITYLHIIFVFNYYNYFTLMSQFVSKTNENEHTVCKACGDQPRMRTVRTPADIHFG